MQQPSGWRIVSGVLCAALALSALACSHGKEASAAAPDGAAASSAVAAPEAPATSADYGPPPAFDSARAMQYVKELVAFGPRPLGSANHKKVEDYIIEHLKGDAVENDAFDIDTTEGKFPVRNIIAKYPGKRNGIIVIASHYETNWPLRNTSYVGANDGASSSALLLEIANQLRGEQRDGYSVWLVWDDAEESMRLPWFDPESLYGVRHLAKTWAGDGTIKKIKGFLLEDMIGDADLNIEHDENSTAWLEDMVYQAATQLGYQSHFFGRDNRIEDDHRPFMDLGVPCVDFIDLDYGYGNVFWHTPQDTVDKLSPKSLEIVGRVTLRTVQMLEKR